MHNARTLSRISRLGLSLTTVGTAYLFFLGRSYYSGLFGKYGAQHAGVQLGFADTIVPNLYSLIFLYHVLLSYVSWDYQFPDAGREAGSAASPTTWERRIVRFQTLLSIAGLLYFLFGPGRAFIGLTILGGGVLGWAIVFVLRCRIPDLRIMGIALAVLVSLIHARISGTYAPADPLKPISVRVRGSNVPLTGVRIYEGPSGLYILQAVDGMQELVFLPASTIEEWRIKRDGYTK